MQKLIDVQEAKEFASTFLADPILKMAVNAVLDNAPAVTDTNVGGKWIPVTERLPENDYGKHWKERARYNVVVNGVVSTAVFGFRNYDWWVDHRGYVFDKEHYKEVTHWQPAPEPPKEVE